MELPSNSEKIAIFYQGQLITFRQFSSLIALRVNEIKRTISAQTSIILIQDDDPLEHWITGLACMHLGITSGPTFKKAKELLTAETYQIVSTKSDPQNISVTPYRKLKTDDAPRDFKLQLSGTKLFFTSGTTGTSKAIKLDLQKIYSRISTRLKLFPKTGCLLSLMPPFGAFGFNFQLGQWLSGGSVILDRDYSQIFKLIYSENLDYIVGSPHQVALLINELEQLPKVGKPKVSEMIIGGGEITPELKRRLAQLFESKLIASFGALETGHWSKNDVTHTDKLTALGEIAPEALIDFDTADDKLILKVKTPHMASCYFIDEAGSLNLRGGWFYSGDQIAIDPDGGYSLLGRDGDVVNVAGVKVNLQSIDDFLTGTAGVKDAACFWIKNDMGYPEIWAAVVTAENLESLYKKTLISLGPATAPKRIIPVAFIPRTFSGKPQRKLMSEKIVAMLAGRDNS